MSHSGLPAVLCPQRLDQHVGSASARSTQRPDIEYQTYPFKYQPGPSNCLRLLLDPLVVSGENAPLRDDALAIQEDK